MPNLNRRGPNGEGSRTGRGLGRCNPQNKGKTDEEILRDRTENDSNQEIFYGRGRQLGYGQGRGLDRGNGLGLGRGQGPHLGRNR